MKRRSDLDLPLVVVVLLGAVVGFAVALYWSERDARVRLSGCPLCGQEVRQ